MLKLLPYGWASSPGRWIIAVAVTTSFALLARSLRGVSLSGAVVGAAACLALFAGAGPAGFAVLGVLFLLTWLSTRVGHHRKHELGLAEHVEGRGGWQVSANLAVAAFGSILFGAAGNSSWLIAVVSALAEAATDTVASEIGQGRTRTARLITTWKVVPAGTDGGITLVGSLAGLAASLVIALTATFAGMIPRIHIWIPVATGFTGMLADSILGDLCQRRGWINNETVNVCGTLIAAVLGFALAL